MPDILNFICISFKIYYILYIRNDIKLGEIKWFYF